jgi:hypothetical protein
MSPPYKDKDIVEMLVRNDGMNRDEAFNRVDDMSLKEKLHAVQDQMMRFGDGAAVLEGYRKAAMLDNVDD